MRVQVIPVEDKSSKNLDRRGFLRTSLSATSALLLLPILATTPSRAVAPVILGIVRVIGGLLTSRFIAVGLIGIYATSAWSRDDIKVEVDVENPTDETIYGSISVELKEKNENRLAFKGDTKVSIQPGKHTLVVGDIKSNFIGQHELTIQSSSHEGIITGYVNS